MSSPNSRRSVLETVAKRCPVLEALEDGPHHKRDLVEELECSRSTIDRAIRELESLELIERTDGTYRPTVAGGLVLAEYRRSVGTLESIARVSDVLAYIPRDAPMAACMLEGATVTHPKPHAPNEPLRRIAQQIDDADRFRVLAGSERIPQFRNHLYERTINDGLDVEAVITDDLAEFVLGNHPEQVTDVVVHGEFDFYIIDSVPYRLILLETTRRSTAYLLIEGEIGDIVIENSAPAAFEWADDIYRRYRAIATGLEIPDPPEDSR